MAGNPSRYDIGAIRELLLAAFTAVNLPRFCQDHPLLQPIVGRFGPKYNLEDMVGEVIGYCQAQHLMDELLSQVKEANPRQYARFEPRLQISAQALAQAPCPYRGLEPFEAEHAEFYFGREEMVCRLVAHLAGHPFVALVGPSGCGKSSLARAGLVTALRQGALPGSQDWEVRHLSPRPRPAAGAGRAAGRAARAGDDGSGAHGRSPRPGRPPAPGAR